MRMILLFFCVGCVEHRMLEVCRDDDSLIPPCAQKIMEGECINK